MKSWKIRLGLMLTMLAMLLAISVPAAAQEWFVQVDINDCIGDGVDNDGNGVPDDGLYLCPVDPNSFPVVTEFEEENEAEDIEDEFDALADFLEECAELDIDCGEDFDVDGDEFFADFCDDDDDDDCDDGDRFNSLFDDDDCDDDGDDDCDDGDRFNSLFDDDDCDDDGDDDCDDD